MVVNGDIATTDNDIWGRWNCYFDNLLNVEKQGEQDELITIDGSLQHVTDMKVENALMSIK